MADALTTAVEDTKGLTPTQRQNLLSAGQQAARDRLKRFKDRTANVQLAQWKPLPLTLLSMVGGFGAEYVRRQLVGRATTSIRTQAVLLGLAGWGVQTLGAWSGIPALNPIGAAHASYAGALLAVSLHGTDEKPDAVRIALEGTTYKALHPKKADDRK